MKDSKIFDFLYGLFFMLFWRISSWICSLPMWITLLLHFLTGLPLYWFWTTLVAWLLVGIIRYMLIIFARWGSNDKDEYKTNKNPYSRSNNDMYK